MTESVPRGRLLLWALLIPLTYAPGFLLGSRPGPLRAAAVLGAFAVALFVVWRLGRDDALDRLARRLDPIATRLLWVAVALYVGTSMVVANAKLAAFADYNQVGLFGQSFWTLLHGHPFANTHETVDGSLGSHFGIHFSPTLLIILPFYALWPKPIVLLAAQAIALGLAAVPLFHLLRPRLGGAGALVLALAMLAHPIFLWGGMRDFRDTSFLPALLLATIWALENRRRGAFFVVALAALGVREEMGLVFVMLGLYALLRGLGGRTALRVAALGVAWFAVVVGFVMPRFWSPGLWIDPRRFFVSVLGPWGPTPLEAVRGMLAHPAELVRTLAGGDRVRYLYNLVGPLLLLPPFGELVAVVALPGLMLNLLSNLPFMRDPLLPYSMVPITVFVLATGRLVARVTERAPEPRRAATGLAAALVVFAGVVPSLRPIGEPPSPPARAAAAVVRVIPPRVPVYGPVTLYPALANREDFGCWWSTGPIGREPGFRARYRYVVLWPAGDPPGVARDGPLADSLARDPRFVARTGFEPLLLFERR